MKSRGSRIAEVLTGAWRTDPPAVNQPVDDLTATLLLRSGSSALAWRRVRGNEAVSFELRQAYRLHLLEAAVHERDIQRLSAFVASIGVSPILGKGWAIARLYPEPALRPYGDFDLYVRPDDYFRVTAALASPNAPQCRVDLHQGATELDDRSFNAVYAQSRLVKCAQDEMRIFCPEDHLRLLCLHMVFHGAWRPLWLCDVAVALESRPPDFDWEYCLSGDPRRSDWVACAIGLAHQLLGARVEGTPVEWRAKNLPRWLIPAVLQQWGHGRLPDGGLLPMSRYLRHPGGACAALRLRWPNPIEATVRMHGAFNGIPRLPYQLGECLARTARFARRLPRLLREQVG